ncbi:MAG TPA: hypothetical protein VH575_15715 [Gemmataceae bacterium]
MSWYTDWFLADEGEAEAVAGIADDDEHSFDDWPHLAMKSIGDMELMSLRGVLRGEESTAEYEGDTLYQRYDDEGGVAVCRVLPEFIVELAALSPKQVKRVAGQWRQHESMADWEPGTVAAVLREMIEFARRAGREGKPVLQCSTW